MTSTRVNFKRDIMTLARPLLSISGGMKAFGTGSLN